MYLIISRKINSLDNYILYTMRRYLKNRYLDIIMPVITCFGNLGAVWLIISLALSFIKPFRMIWGIVMLTLIISTVIGEGIVKHVIRRIRPCNQLGNSSNLIISVPRSYSFPSGHTLSSFAAAEVLSVYFSQYKLAFMVLALLIALSRLYLYVHYPTDVIAGAVIGILCSKLVFMIIQDGYTEKFIGYLRT